MESYEQQSKENFWGDTLEMIEEPKPKPAAPDPSQNGQAQPPIQNAHNPQPATVNYVKPFNRQVAEAKGRMATSGMDLCLRMTLGPLGNYRMNKLYAKYIPDEAERERAAELIIEHKPPATDKENRNVKYMEKLLKKHSLLQDQTKLSEEQRKDIVRMLSDYEEATGKSMSAEVVLYGGLIGILGVKVYEVMTLDINVAA